MFCRKTLRWGAPGLGFMLLAGTIGSSAADANRPIPKGSEKAVAAIQREFSKAEIDEVTEPKGFGGSGGKGTPMFWSIRFHVGDTKHELSVMPDGTIMRLPTAVEAKDLPKPVAEAVAKVVPGATIRSAERNEMRATLKYVALDKPQALQYVIDAVKESKRWRVTMNGEGANAKATELKEEPKDTPSPKPAEREPAKEKEIDIPPKAAKAVRAIKAVHPDAVVKEITTEVFDDGTGEIEILTYEVEFISKGAKHEMVASPEGVIPHLWATLEAKALPKAITDAVDKAVPGATVDKAQAQQIRATLRFGPIEKPKTYYTVRVEKEGKTQTVKIKPDGTVIKDLSFRGQKGKD